MTYGHFGIALVFLIVLYFCVVILWFLGVPSWIVIPGALVGCCALGRFVAGDIE